MPGKVTELFYGSANPSLTSEATMLDVTQDQDSISFDIPLLMGELSFITGPHAASMLRRLADALDLDLINFFPDSHDETHVSRFIEFLRRIEKAKIVYVSTTED
jgi:hypothetical protein